MPYQARKVRQNVSSCSPARGYKFISNGSSVVVRVRFTENSLGSSGRWIYFASLVLFSGQKCEALQCVYLAEKDRCIFSDSHAVSLRRDLRGILLLDTALQTPVSRAEDVIKLEIPLAEVRNWPGEVKDGPLKEMLLWTGIAGSH